MEAPLATSGAAAESWTLEIPPKGDAHLTKEHGPQGGYHVFVDARLTGPTLREDFATPTTSSGFSYAHVEVEVIAGETVISRSVSLASSSTIRGTTLDLPALYAYVDADVGGEVTINIKVVTADKSKWASATRQFFVEP